MSQAPYPGLRPFTRGEADIFFGREAQTDELVDRLGHSRFLSVVGPSGCGKSSLVRAGLLDALESGFMASAGAGWHIAEMRPGGQPMWQLADALLTMAGRPRYEHDSAFLQAALERGPRSLIEYLQDLSLPKDENLLILVDQFEEIFRFAPGAGQEEADAFVALLLATIDLQKRNWKFEAGFHEHTGVSLPVPLPTHSRGGHPRVYENTAQARHRQRPLPPPATCLSAR